MKCVYIMQGIPGSGKSTWISQQPWKNEAIICSADSYFTGTDGVYRFNPTKLAEAHGACLRSFLGALQESNPIVVVDNTNLTAVEMAPYYALARVHGYEVAVISCEVDVEVAAQRNIHGVNIATLRAMFAKKERDLPFFWSVKRYV